MQVDDYKAILGHQRTSSTDKNTSFDQRKLHEGPAVMIFIGLLVEGRVFNTLERVTVRRWGMQR